MQFAYKPTALAIGVVLASCSGVLGLSELTPYRGEGTDGGPSTQDAGPGGSEPGAAGSTGVRVNPPCDPAELPHADGIFVSARPPIDGGAPVDAGAPGAATAPFSTIAAAIEHAKTNGKERIYLEEDTYPEPIILEGIAGSIVIDGGWIWRDTAWVRDCSEAMRQKTVIQSPGGVGVRVSGVKGRSGLRNLTVQTRPSSGTAIDAPATSRIGVLVRDDSPFFLFNTTVLAASAAPGGNASDGALGLPTCTTTSSCIPGAAGTDSPDTGSATLQGVFSADGFAPADAPAALPGTPGANGAPGGVGQSATDCNTGCPGSCTDSLTALTAPSGMCGCGGGGGGAGKPGRGGGASVALLAAGAVTRVEVTSSELIAGHGGAATSGGKGAAGGQPTDGAPGAALTCNRPGCCSDPNTGACSYKDDPAGSCYDGTSRKLPGGLKGGTGAPGGKGGSSGGGSGGPAYAIVRVGAAAVVTADSFLAHGDGGRGAMGAPSGATGISLVVP